MRPIAIATVIGALGAGALSVGVAQADDRSSTPAASAPTAAGHDPAAPRKHVEHDLAGPFSE